jgi:hypothetical protein
VSAPELAVVRERAESARADALEAIVAAQTEHAEAVGGFARALAQSMVGLRAVPAETVNHLLLAVATFAEKGGKQG